MNMEDVQQPHGMVPDIFDVIPYIHVVTSTPSAPWKYRTFREGHPWQLSTVESQHENMPNSWGAVVLDMMLMKQT